MSQTEHDGRMDYIELPGQDMEALKTFYHGVFGWNFTDYGPDYVSFHDGRLSGGFTSTLEANGGGPLVVLYATDLNATREAITAHGGEIVRDTFDFPGGRRFHFKDPHGNELAVWSE